MKVTVVIPAYNEGLYIEECLGYLHQQTVKPDEIIVVDNNSRDDTAEKARRLGAIVIEESTQGMTYARNAGFNAAKYEIIARCDVDSHVPPDWIERIKQHYENDPAVVGVSGPGKVYDHSALINNKPFIHSLSYFALTKSVLGYDTLYGANMSLLKKYWDKIKDSVCMDNKIVHEDLDVAINLHPYGKIDYDPELVVGISARRFKENPLNTVEYVHRWLKTLRHHKLFPLGDDRNDI